MVAVIILFTLASLVYWGVTFVTLYHLVRFGIGTEPKQFAAVFLIGSIAFYSFTLILFITTDLSWLSDTIEYFFRYPMYQ